MAYVARTGLPRYRAPAAHCSVRSLWWHTAGWWVTGGKSHGPTPDHGAPMLLVMQSFRSSYFLIMSRTTPCSGTIQGPWPLSDGFQTLWILLPADSPSFASGSDICSAS